jgi:hypothetical protein
MVGDDVKAGMMIKLSLSSRGRKLPVKLTVMAQVRFQA